MDSVENSHGVLLVRRMSDKISLPLRDLRARTIFLFSCNSIHEQENNSKNKKYIKKMEMK